MLFLDIFIQMIFLSGCKIKGELQIVLQATLGFLYERKDVFIILPVINIYMDS